MKRTALPHLALTTNPTIIIKTSPRLGAHSDGPPVVRVSTEGHSATVGDPPRLSHNKAKPVVRSKAQ